MLFYMLYVAVQIVASNPRHYLLSPCGLLQALCMFTNSLLFAYASNVFNSIFQWSINLPLNTGIITFIRLGQADNLLRHLLAPAQTFKGETVSRSTLEKANYSKQLSRKLSLFYRFHASIRRSVFSQNLVFASMMATNLLVYTPANAYMLFSILFGRVEPITSLIFLVMMLAQVSYIFGIHILAVQYPTRIHASAVLLGRLYIRLNVTGKMDSLLGQLKLSNAFQALLTKKRYGITYGKGRQLVTMATFAKFLYFYLKFLLYSFKINKKATR